MGCFPLPLTTTMPRQTIANVRKLQIGQAGLANQEAHEVQENE
jgi:hypothetical protein